MFASGEIFHFSIIKFPKIYDELLKKGNVDNVFASGEIINLISKRIRLEVHLHIIFIRR